MNADQVRNLLLAFQSGQASLEEAMEQLRTMPFEDLGYAKIDHHRAVRQGFPEVVYCEGKTVEQVASIIEHLA
ncbi:MAG: mutase-like protein, partial [Anaerospora sp.]|nr:mutase-like protein [Anaerospora sp.]